MLVQNATAATRDAVQLPTASSFRSCTEPALSSRSRFIPPLRPSCHPFSLPLLSITEGISRVSRSDFRDIRPRYFIHTHIYMYTYRCLKRESGKTVRRDKRVLQDFSRDKVVRHGDHGQPGARNSKDPEHVACSLSRRDIKSYLRLRYVRWLASWPTHA